MELAEPPTAAITSTDQVAVGVLHAAHSLGVAVPDRLSVVGLDGSRSLRTPCRR